MNSSIRRKNFSMMSSLANTVLFLALVTTSIMVAVMYRKLKRLDQYHRDYQQILDKTGAALQNAQHAVASFGAEGKETLALLGTRIEEAKATIQKLEALNRDTRREFSLPSGSSHS